ncbi:MAG TPA: PH domain-containing protein [Ktedonobacteraceae bacterium]|nr:PH domain-containing protein [Ktedonobacteraceae bacterium]
MANQSKNKPATPAHEAPWRFWRHRLALLHSWRGRDKQWYFFGQQPDEHVRLLVRKHWWFLVQPGLPFAASAAVLFIILWVAAQVPTWASLWYLLELATFLVVLGTGGWFAYRDLISWWYETYIITNKRIIYSRGLLEPTRQQTPIEKVQQVGLDMDDLLGLFLGFGTLHVYLSGGQIQIEEVGNPRTVRDALVGVWEEYKASKPKDAPPPVPKDIELTETLKHLGKPKDVPTLPDADKDLPPLPGADRFIGPRRTFGGFLRIPCNVRYLSGEYTVRYVQRSRYVLWRNLLIPILLLLVAAPLTIAGPEVGFIPEHWQSSWWFSMGLIVTGILIAMALIYMNYVDDVYILTNTRIIDIERYFILFFEKHDETEYKNIRDVKVKIQSILQRVLNIGHVYIETPGSSPDIVMENVDDPFTLQDEILGIRAHKEKADNVKKENKEKETLHTWFSTIVAKLEDATTSRGTPNLKTMDFLSAMAYAQEYGLDVVVKGEAVDHSEISPGRVVYQDPPPGTMMEKGSQIEVVLSKRPSPAPQRTR